MAHEHAPAHRAHPWRGIMVATALPLRDDRSVDYDAYAEHVAWLIANGCDGVVPNGSLGEYQTLTDEERGRVVRTAVEAAGDGARVMPGVSAYGSAESRRWAEQAAEAGAASVLLLPPNAYRADERAVRAHFAEVAAVGLPVVAYNNPLDTKVDLTPDVLARLHGDGSIVAVKEFSGDVRRAYEIAELAPELDLLIGADDVLLELALAGAVGWIMRLSERPAPQLRHALPGRRRRMISASRSRSTSPFTRSCAGTPRSSSSRRSSSPWTSPDVMGEPPGRPVRRWRPRRTPPCAPRPRRPSPRGTRELRRTTLHPSVRLKGTPCVRVTSSTPSTRTPRACPRA